MTAVSVLLASSPVPADVPCELGGADGALAVAQQADRMGDGCVVRWVRDETTERRLRGLWAVRWMDHPDAVLPEVVGVAGGRDPDLAGAAAAAVFDVASRGDVTWEDAGKVETVRALDRILADGSLRADIRAALEGSRALLR